MRSDLEKFVDEIGVHRTSKDVELNRDWILSWIPPSFISVAFKNKINPESRIAQILKEIWRLQATELADMKDVQIGLNKYKLICVLIKVSDDSQWDTVRKIERALAVIKPNLLNRNLTPY